MNKWAVAGALATLLVIVGCGGKGQAGPTPQPPQAQSIQPPSEQPVQNQTVQPEEAHQESTPAPEPSPHVESGTVVSQVYFDFDKYDIRADMQDALDQGAEKIQEYKMKVLLEGNTDEFGTGEYNFALGNKRALSVKQALVLKGIDESEIQVVSFGETKPICQEKTKECYRKNRRVDIKVVD
ncbi:OmpA family protein [Helicobacter salomonis]|uniref:OmpA family protein n=1 Tax=Helicobacter salomonis TaxID=56878 RepID=UPI000CF0325B|nr:OmpA family protein [Helicobacter salomonis]